MASPLSAKPERPAEFPRSFGDYELREEIARGGMGAVYRAWHRPLNRLVALKALLAGAFASRGFVQRFRVEAEAIARLDHPNIVPIYEIGEHDGQPYFSMKLIEGTNLGRVTRPSAAEPSAAISAPLPCGERDADLARAQLVAKLARAVHYAHERGVLHRDLKPNNVILDRRGEPYLTDFGLARLLEADSALTESAAVLGTPGYLSPEQARGATKELTAATDVYGLGAILYELLAGRPPFVGSTSLETIRKVIEQDPTPPSLVRGKTQSDHGGLEVICLKCLEKDPRRRYGSAEDLAEDLERWIQGAPIRARASTRWEHLQKWARRNPTRAALAATVSGALLAIVGVALLLTSQGSWRRSTEANEKLAHSLFTREWQDAEDLVSEGEARGALPWFARAVRDRPNDLALATRLLALLSEHRFSLPQTVWPEAREGGGAAPAQGSASGLPLSAWVREGTVLSRIQVSPSSRPLQDEAIAPDVQHWQLERVKSPAPEWLPDLAEAVAGWRQMEDGELEVVGPERLAALLKQRANDPRPDFYARWARWFLAEGRAAEH